MAERDEAEPGYLVFRWSCTQGSHRVTTKIALTDKEMSVPLCPSCKVPRRMQYARILHAEEAETAKLTEILPEQKQAKQLVKSDLFRRFSNLLDSLRVRMGGGVWSEQFCVLCFEQPHAGPKKCQCECHDHRRYKAELEAIAGEKAA